jgi:hypothetical protein
MSKYRILILGASYGSLLASKILLGGHSVKLICLPEEADLINSEGFRVRLPIRGRSEPVELDSRRLPGTVSASGANEVDPREYDLIGLAMQEPQYGSRGVRELLSSIANSRIPCMSIMNMPPLAYMRRISALDSDTLKSAYTTPEVWEHFDTGAITLCSPDPQAIRPPGERLNVLQVTLPTNFKVARFDDARGNRILRRLEKQIDAARWDGPEGKMELPVKLRFYDSVFVPLAKWAMLMAGNYRCITEGGVRTAQEAVHLDLAASRSIYDFVVEVCVRIGASGGEMVHSKNMPPLRRNYHGRPLLLAHLTTARKISNGRTSWFNSSRGRMA